MQSIGLPEEVLTNANRLCSKFIWQKRFSNRKEFEKIKEGNYALFAALYTFTFVILNCLIVLFIVKFE